MERNIDEGAAMDGARERSALEHPRDVLKREMLDEAKGRPRDIALEKHGADTEAQVIRELVKNRKAERNNRQSPEPEAWRGRRGPGLDMDR